ncbi:MAG: protein kinase [Sedimentisphaerales bacterium]|nr:protein kinase [Sedimentisphaerales bacterium]
MSEILEIKAEKAKKLKLTRGMRLRKYRLAACLGKGGSSEVWKARDCVEGIWVALKIPIPESNGERDNKALLKEIRMVSQLRHRHIMPVKNADIINGHVVLATELSFKTLDDCSRPMSVKRIISIIWQVLDGLAYAHRKRLVHCDVTPGNIFLFPDGRAAMGDFGISMELKGRIVTSDVYGTSGYISPEQAYGRPTYRSDCFVSALVLYEFITGYLPRWPFRWPPKGYKRLKEKTNLAFVDFMRKALSVDPDKRFANAGQMRDALLAAVPKRFKTVSHLKGGKKRIDWKKARRETFLKRYGKTLIADFNCSSCGEPIAESMQVCPWCGSDRNRFDKVSNFDYICQDCHRGVGPQWRYCPWCYNTGFKPQKDKKAPQIKYQGKCRHCGGKMMRFMQYCPWCHRKVRNRWKVSKFPEICNKCNQPVDTDYWQYCPWCSAKLT